jgi:hypothetical protein
MKVPIIERPATVNADTNLGPSRVAELPVGSELERGEVRESAFVKWVSVTLADGRRGYMLAGAKERVPWGTGLRYPLECSSQTRSPSDQPIGSHS